MIVRQWLHDVAGSREQSEVASIVPQEGRGFLCLDLGELE
jgi:hypothetical protein